VVAHPLEAINAQGIPLEATIGISIEYPIDGDKLLRTPPTFVYSPQDGGNPSVVANLETMGNGGTVGIALTDLANGGSCTLVTVPVHESHSGASVNYDSDPSRRKTMPIQFTRLGPEDRLDETSWESIDRMWWRVQLAISAPRTRYVVDCPVTTKPRSTTPSEREISFALPRGTHFPPLFPAGEVESSSDDTIAMVMFRLEDARDVHFEGRVADTPNSAAAHRFKVTFVDGKVTARWTDAAAERRQDLLQFLAGALAAFGATIVFELLKLRFPLEQS
jgi:hypothetical protein